jgi:hypothetical protein
VPDSILGLPVHPLIVHAVVVLVPLAAVLVAAAAVSPRFRAWSLYATPLVSLVALGLVPLATDSGEGLQRTVANSALVQEHAEMGDTLLPLMLGVTLLAFVQSWLHWRGARTSAADGSASVPAGKPARSAAGPQTPRAVVLTVAALALLLSLGTLVQVGRIGHSGAKAVWTNVKVSGGESGG